MKPLWLTRNRRHPQAGTRREAPRLSLFPFLAVLICTMGALMLLLLFVSRQARLQAARETAARDAEKQTKIAAAMDLAQWRVDQLKTSRKATAAQLAEARLLLGHIEDHGRRLRGQFAELSAQAKKADAAGLKPGNFAAPGEEELRQLEGQIAEAQHSLARSQQAAANRPKSYAIVPYEGPNRTRRRPIYIECRGDAVVLQPEKIVFGEADFDEPLGPGNPLAAAIRAVREQMLMERNIDPQNDGEPYPLLLVRPDGILFYQCALAAMKSWGPDFGYELIKSDWQLKYPPPDPNVERAVVQAVELARQEHARLVAAAPSKYGKRPSSGQYRSSLAGGAEDQGAGGDGSPGVYSSKPDRYGQQYADSGSASGNGSGGQGRSGSNGSSPRNSSGNGHSRGGSGSGIGGGDLDGEENSVTKADEEFATNNPYQSMGFPSGTNSAGGGVRTGGGIAGGYVGAPSAAGGFAGGPSGSGVPGGGVAGGYGGTPGAGGGFASSGGTGAPAQWVDGLGAPGGIGSGPVGYTGGGFAGGTGAGSGGGGPPGLSGPSYGGAADGGNGLGGGPGGSTGMASGGVPPIYTPMFGQTASPGDGGVPAQQVGGSNLGGNAQGGASGGASGAAQPGTQANGQAAYQGGGQPNYQANGQPGGAAGAAAVARPDGFITGRPNDPNPNPPPQQRPDASSGMAMVPATPLRPGEWRPSDDAPPPKPDPDKDKKKKNPYENVDPDRSQADWALRNVRSHAAAISRPLHVDCYADRVVIAPDQPGGEPHVIVLGGSSRRNADKLVAAMWEIMDSWGMAGKEMYWRPVLNFYVAPGAEPRMLELSRALGGSGLVIERKR